MVGWLVVGLEVGRGGEVEEFEMRASSLVVRNKYQSYPANHDDDDDEIISLELQEEIKSDVFLATLDVLLYLPFPESEGGGSVVVPIVLP